MVLPWPSDPLPGAPQPTCLPRVGELAGRGFRPETSANRRSGKPSRRQHRLGSAAPWSYLKWLVFSDLHLTARAAVSRTWRHCLLKLFGSRQVPTVDGKIIACSPRNGTHAVQ